MHTGEEDPLKGQRWDWVLGCSSSTCFVFDVGSSGLEAFPGVIPGLCSPHSPRAAPTLGGTVVASAPGVPGPSRSDSALSLWRATPTPALSPHRGVPTRRPASGRTSVSSHQFQCRERPVPAVSAPWWLPSLALGSPLKRSECQCNQGPERGPCVPRNRRGGPRPGYGREGPLLPLCPAPLRIGTHRACLFRVARKTPRRGVWLSFAACRERAGGCS